MFGIAWRYRVSVEDLMAANPDVNPNMMSVGAKLVIPASLLPEPSSEPPTPTPMPVEVGQLHCARSEEGGVWCFLPVHNAQDVPLENISAVFRLADTEAKSILPKTGFLPLDLLPPGATLPLVVYYPPPLPEPFQASAEVITGLPNPVGDGRYEDTQVENLTVDIPEGGTRGNRQTGSQAEEAGGASRAGARSRSGL